MRFNSSLTLSLAMVPGMPRQISLCLLGFCLPVCVLGFADEAAAQVLGVAEVDLRPGGPRRTERKARELQPGRSRFGDVANHIEGVVLRLRVLFLVEDFQAVVDGADGTDHVVTDLAGNQSRKLEIGWLDALCHRIALAWRSVRRRRRLKEARTSDA